MKLYLNPRAQFPPTWAPRGGSLLVVANSKAEAADMLSGRPIPEQTAKVMARGLKLLKPVQYGAAIQALRDAGISLETLAVYAWYESDRGDADFVIRIDPLGRCSLIGKFRYKPGEVGLYLEPITPMESETSS
ncbi:hypothetical protein [Microbispora sp. NPDC049125]|uniref:hypothetical protein n=1 Tax=Microbispora sp. NPDC049125 TaxID=3154929 RepID=UPI0034670BED